MISKGKFLPPRSGARESGFSIVEVLIALLILGAGMLALVRLQTSMTDSASVAKQRTEATKLAQKKVEELRSFTSAGAFDTQFSGTPPTTCASVTIQGENTTYTLSCTATVTAANSLQGRYAALTVSVAWKDQKTQDHAVQLQTTVTRSSPADAGLLLTPAPNSTVFCASGETRQWTVGSFSCQGAIPSAGTSGSVVTVLSSSSNTGNNQYQCTASGWTEVVGFAKTCDPACTGTTRTWAGAGGEQCTASIGTSQVGSTVAVTDSTAPATGSASYQCLSGGIWATNANAGATCTAVCAGQTVDWNGTGQNLSQCRGTLGSLTFNSSGGNTTSFNNSSSAGGVTITATATYACANTGAWSLSTSVCSSTSNPSPTSCPATNVTWGTAPATCSGSLAASSIGGTGTASQTTGNTTGNASYTCNSAGTWGVSTQSCSLCSVSLSGTRVSTATRFWYRIEGTSSSFTEITGLNGSCTTSSTTEKSGTRYLYSCISVPISGNTRTTYEIKSTNSSGTDVGNTNTFRTNNNDGATCGSNYTNEDLCTGNAC